MKNEKFLNIVKVITLAAILAVGIQYVSAQTWTPPTTAPPAGNTFAPLNVGDSGQVKAGGLTLGSTVGSGSFGLLLPSGRLGIGSGVENFTGSTYDSIKLHIYGPSTQRIVVQSTDGVNNNSAARLDLKDADTAWHMQAWSNMFSIVESNVHTRMAIAEGGNVGIGHGTGADADATTDPAAALYVNGKVKITDGTQGAGKVLTSNATGLASWQTAGSNLQIVYTNCTPVEVGATNTHNNVGRNGIAVPDPNSGWLCDGDNSGKVVTDLGSNGGNFANGDYVLCCTQSIQAQ